MSNEENHELDSLFQKIVDLERRLDEIASSSNVAGASGDSVEKSQDGEPTNDSDASRIEEALRRLDEAEESVRELRERLDEMEDEATAEDEEGQGAELGGTGDVDIPQVVVPDAVETVSSNAPYSSTDWIKERGNVIQLYGFDGDDNGGTVEIVADADYASGTAGTASGSGAEQTGGTGAATSGDGSGDEPRNVRLHLTNPDGTWAPTSQWMIPVREDRDGIRTLRWCRLGGEVDFAATFSGNDAPYLLKVRLTNKTDSYANVECYFPDSGVGDFPPGSASSAPHVTIGGEYNNSPPPHSGWCLLGTVTKSSSSGHAYVIAKQGFSQGTSVGANNLSTLARTEVSVLFFATQTAFDDFVNNRIDDPVPNAIYSVVAYVNLDTLDVVQCGVGPHSVQPALTDTEVTGDSLSYYKSLDRPTLNQGFAFELEMHNFRSPPNAGSGVVTLSEETEEDWGRTVSINFQWPSTPSNATYLVPVRREITVSGNKQVEIVWVSLNATGSFSLPPRDQGTYGDNLYEWFWDVDNTGVYGVRVVPNTSIAVVKLDDYFWPRGEDETKCYGSAIGDSSQTKVIDLNGKVLSGGYWSVDTGGLDIASDLSVGNNMQVDGSTNLDGALTVSGHTNLGSVSTGPLNVGGTLTVGNDVYAPTQITVGGQTYTVLAKVQP